MNTAILAMFIFGYAFWVEGKPIRRSLKLALDFVGIVIILCIFRVCTGGIE